MDRFRAIIVKAFRVESDEIDVTGSTRISAVNQCGYRAMRRASDVLV